MFKIPASCVLMLFSVLSCNTGLALTRTWSGAGSDSLWNNSANWFSPPGLPTDAVDNVVFKGTKQASHNDRLSSVINLTFDADATSGINLTGNALTITGNVTSSNTATNTIGMNVSLSAASGTNTLSVATGSILNITGQISGAAGILRTGAGTLRLSNANNSFAGVVAFSTSSANEITFLANAGSNSSLGAASGANGTIQLGGASTQQPTLTYTGATNSSTDRVINLIGTTGNRTLEANGTGAAKFLGGATINTTNATFVLSGSSTAANEIGHILLKSGSAGLTKSGSGTWILSGSNTYTGATSVQAGTLVINGDSSGATGNVTITGTGTVFGGSGTIGGATTLGNSSAVGVMLSPTGKMTFKNGLALSGTMAGGPTIAFNGGSSIDVTGGTLNLSNNDWTLKLGNGFQNDPTGSVILFTFNAVSGSRYLTPHFDISSLSFTPSTTLFMTQEGNTLVLHGLSAIPEPNSLALACLSLGALACSTRWFRNRRS